LVSAARVLLEYGFGPEYRTPDPLQYRRGLLERPYRRGIRKPFIQYRDEGEDDLSDHHAEQDRVDHPEAKPHPRRPRPAHGRGLSRHGRGRISTGFYDRRIDGTHTAPHSPGRSPAHAIPHRPGITSNLGHPGVLTPP